MSTSATLAGVMGNEHGGSTNMRTDRTRHATGRRGHLRLATPGEAPPRITVREAPAPPTPAERRAMSRVAALLRRRATRLPEGSPLREELLDVAEYYATGVEEPAGARVAEMA